MKEDVALEAVEVGLHQTGLEEEGADAGEEGGEMGEAGEGGDQPLPRRCLAEEAPLVFGV